MTRFFVTRFFARGRGVFSSARLAAHLLRGAVAAALLAWAVSDEAAHPVPALVAAAAALVALRGCPLCWTVGLVETLAERRRPSRPGRPSPVVPDHLASACGHRTPVAAGPPDAVPDAPPDVAGQIT